MRKIFFFLILTLFVFLLTYKFIFAIDVPDYCSQDTILRDKVTDCTNILQQKVNELGDQKNTLKSQISQFDTQIHLTQIKVNDAQNTINQLEKEIGVLGFRIGYISDSIDKLETQVKQRIVATYQQSFISNLELVVSSNDFSDLLLRLQYLKQIQENDKRLLSSLQQTKSNYANQKDERQTKQAQIEASQKQLEDLQVSLNQQKSAKNELLVQTQGSEATYQKLLEQAQAQISAFKSFASFQGGSQILPAQPSPDGWYYNQRDERWGRHNIGSSSEQIWEVGCLVTSTAMVLKKHGNNVTPADVASNTSYFFSNTAYMLIPWVGGKINSFWGFDSGTVNSKLSSGEPVIVGIKGGPFGQHFVVLKSGSGGNYTMNDPWNGPDLKFSDYYSTSAIFQYGYYAN